MLLRMEVVKLKKALFMKSQVSSFNVDHLEPTEDRRESNRYLIDDAYEAVEEVPRNVTFNKHDFLGRQHMSTVDELKEETETREFDD